MLGTNGSARRLALRVAAGLGAVAVAAGVTAAGATGASAAQAAPSPLIPPVNIAVNTVNWSGSAGFGSASPSWFKDSFGIVHLQGAARQVNPTGTLRYVLGTLPAAARPARNVFVIVHTYLGTYADLEVAQSGQINLIDPYGFAVKDYKFVSLEGISYSPSALFNHMSPPFPGLNTVNWASAVFGASDPGWVEDGSGVIHLQGAATQISLAGDKNLLATLVPIIRPNRTIYTIVHTFNGTYADLSIAPNGQVRLIDPAPPMGKDYTFVSLEGVTYQP